MYSDAIECIGEDWSGFFLCGFLFCLSLDRDASSGGCSSLVNLATVGRSVATQKSVLSLASLPVGLVGTLYALQNFVLHISVLNNTIEAQIRLLVVVDDIESVI